MEELTTGLAIPDRGQILFPVVLKLRELAIGVSWGLFLFLKLSNYGRSAKTSESSARSGRVTYPLSETSAILLPLKVDTSPNFIWVLLPQALDVEFIAIDQFCEGEDIVVDRRAPNVYAIFI